MIQRLKDAWAVLRGKWRVKQRSIYVRDEGNPNRFVQLIPYHDGILALTASGQVYRLNLWPTDQYYMELIFDSPTRRF